ncbi:MAG: DUF805 domain-containing protein [Acidimicrobiales bacterium]
MLTVPTGRDTPRQFWTYTGALLAGQMLASGVMGIAGAAGMVGIGLLRWSEVSALMLVLVAVAGVNAVVVCSLVGAAACRRLHDTGRSGLWALPPFLALVVSFALMILFLLKTDPVRPEPSMVLFLVGFFSNLVYLGVLGVLVFLLVLPGSDERNRFGVRDTD